jgi:membrane dipeptidase
MDFSYIEKINSVFREDNVSGVIANLYFTSQEEMKEELGDNYGDIDVVDMFRISTNLFKEYFPDIEVIYSIEGCDYIKDTDELEELYNLGLRNILLVWNNPNKYGSGNKGDYGLTDEGKEFIKKAIDLGISIDFSHMNKNTFNDTYELVKEEIKNGKSVKVIASHSNSYSVCPHIRNLTDEQLKCLKELDAIVGVVSYSGFVLSTSSSTEDLKSKYLEHINHVVSIMGKYNVGISTDDMDFSIDLFNDDCGPNTFNYNTVKKELTELLKDTYLENEIENILHNNIYNKLF